MTLLSSLILSPVVAEAHSGDIIKSSWACSPPIIDGVISPMEWGASETLTFYSVPGGGVFCTLNLYVMNDDLNLYIAAVWPDSTPNVDDAILFLFDPQHDGVSTDDDEDGIHVGLLETLEDMGYTPSPGAGDLFDGYYDTSGLIHALLPFGNDPEQHGIGVRTHDGSNWILETCKPLRSGDPHDMYVKPCQTMGFGIFIMDILTEWPNVAAGVWPESGLSIFPEKGLPEWENAAGVAADLLLACPPPVGGVMVAENNNPLIMPIITVMLTLASSLIVLRKLRHAPKK